MGCEWEKMLVISMFLLPVQHVGCAAIVVCFEFTQIIYNAR